MNDRENKNRTAVKGISFLAIPAEDHPVEDFAGRVASLKGDIPCEVFLVSDEGGEDRQIQGIPVRIVDAGEGVPAALNRALEEASFDVIHVTDTSCEYDEDGLREVMSCFRGYPEADMVSLMPYMLDVKGKKKKLLSFNPEPETDWVDLLQTPEHWTGYLFAMFIRREAAEGIRFHPELEYEYLKAFAADIYTEARGYCLLKKKVISHEFQDTDFYNYEPQHFTDWYMEELPRLAAILNEPAGDPIRMRILFDFINQQFACNLNNRDKGLLAGDDLQRYRQIVAASLQGVDDDVIAIQGKANVHKRLPPFARNLFLCMKHDREYMPIHLEEVIDDNGDPKRMFLTDNGTVMAGVTGFHANIAAMNLYGDDLEIEGELANIFFDDLDSFKLWIRDQSGREIPVTRSPIYNHTYLFGITARHGLSFRVRVPLGKGRTARYAMVLRYKGLELELAWYFTKPQARLKETHRRCYWNAGGYSFRYDKSGKRLLVDRANPLKTAYRELRYDISVMKPRKTKAAIKTGLHIVGLRLLYYLTRPKYGGRNIWITFDQLFKGGDNGEYFYRYVSGLKNGKQEIYYIVNEDTKEYRELTSLYGTALPYNSRKARLLSLHSRIVLTTRAGVLQYLGFTDEERFFRGLYNFDVVCLQHGLSIQRIAEYQNRLFDNLKFYYCVSRYEVENLSKPIYGFFDRSMLKLTGAPRYDGLKSAPRKQIIITPTWRRNVTSGTNTKGKNHEYSANFRQTEYYRIYNGLINDEKLIRTAQETGYRLIYLIHPILSPQIGDFDRNDYVDIVPGSQVNYEKILTESALMVTDHSGIMYDFAYQRKPLVYYHPDSLPPQYGEGGLKYDTMGFGPVCKTHQQTVDAICEMMKKDCVLDDMYRARIDDFFEFNDFNNCERAYQATCEYQAERR